MTDYDIVATSDDGKLRVVLVQDEDCEKPMDNDDGWITSLLVCDHAIGGDWHGEHDVMDRESALIHFNNANSEGRYGAYTTDEDMFIRYMRIVHDIEVFEIEITNGYRDTSRALAWVEPTERERVGVPDTYPASDVVKGEIEEHNRWAEGDCYGYVIQKLVRWIRESSLLADGYDDAEGRVEWEDTDESCWGFIGREYAEQEATEALAGYQS